MRVNHGRQEWYRQHGSEPACVICAHYQPHPDRPGVIWCSENKWFVDPGSICTQFDREPGTE